MDEDRIDAMERRLAALERRIEGEAPPRPGADTNHLMGVMHAWRRSAEERSAAGTVGYVGAAYLAGDLVQWGREHSLDELLPADWSPAAAVLESLASGPRLALIGALVREGRLTSTELLETLGGEEGETTSGQLYHHLRALQAARLIRQRKRGEYELAPGAVMPILTILGAALAHATDPPIGIPGPR